MSGLKMALGLLLLKEARDTSCNAKDIPASHSNNWNVSSLKKIFNFDWDFVHGLLLNKIFI